jgi:hypothetical protein
VTLGACVLAALKAASPRVGLPLAPFAALAVLLVPTMDELLPSIANVHWFGAVILVLVAASQVPSSRWQAIGDAGLVVLFGLSGPFIVALSPVIVWRAVRTRSRAAWATAALAVVAACLQIAAYRQSTAGAGAVPLPSATTVLAALGYRTGGQMFGLAPSPLFANPLPWGIAGAALLVLIWLLFPLRARGRDLRPLLAWAALSAVAGGFMRYAGYAGQFFEPVFINRYFYEIIVFTLWILICALGTSGARRWFAAALLALVVACNAGRFRLPPFAELDWPHHALAIEQGKAVTVPINPQAWFVGVPARH